MVNAIGEAAGAAAALAGALCVVEHTNAPAIKHPKFVLATGRCEIAQRRSDVFGVVTARTRTLSRQQLLAPQAAATPPAAAGDAKTLTGGEAWLSIVGNTLTGKIDGDVFFEFYRKDGTLNLMEGSDLTKGKWTIEGEKVCFKYPDEDKDCFTVTRTGQTVTLGGGKGKGLRLTLLPGNPKDL